MREGYCLLWSLPHSESARRSESTCAFPRAAMATSADVGSDSPRSLLRSSIVCVEKLHPRSLRLFLSQTCLEPLHGASLLRSGGERNLCPHQKRSTRMESTSRKRKALRSGALLMVRSFPALKTSDILTSHSNWKNAPHSPEAPLRRDRLQCLRKSRVPKPRRKR
jgi:hypothetical protein